jgi:hypothetical protein
MSKIQNPIGFPFGFTTNGNGTAVRLGRFLLQYRQALTLSFVTSATLGATWTFPTAFKSATTPVVFGMMQAAAPNATPNLQQIGEVLSASTPTVTAAEMRITRQAGQTSFEAGDTIVIGVFAVGEAP